jgi:hypothetical protein
MCHSIFKGIGDLAYLHDGSLLAECESDWCDHIPETKIAELDVFQFRWDLALPGRIRRYRHSETISTGRSRRRGDYAGRD